jgi:beta-galactosidase
MPPKTTIQSKIRLRVFDDNQLNVDGDCQLNDEIWKRAQSVDPAQAAAGGNSSEHIILNFVDTIQDVHAWTAETPNLYTLTIEYLETSPEDENILVQCESCRIGFRTVTIDTDQGGILKVNGTAITVCGINRHEHDPDHGKVASLERMKQDIITLK